MDDLTRRNTEAVRMQLGLAARLLYGGVVREIIAGSRPVPGATGATPGQLTRPAAAAPEAPKTEAGSRLYNTYGR